MALKAKNVDNYERLFKTVSDAKTYSKALAVYIDRKTSTTKEILDIMLDVYANDVLYTEGSEVIDVNILPTDLQYVPISVVPTFINDVANTNFESMYVTALELAKALNNAISNDDPDIVQLDLVNWKDDCSFSEIVQSCCENYQEFVNGYVSEVTFFNPFDFNLSEFNENEHAQAELHRGMITININDYHTVENSRYVRTGNPPTITISVSQTLQRIADTVNQNKLTTLLFNVLGSSKTVTRANIMAEANRVLGSAVNRTISLDDTLYNIAVDDGIPIADRISYMVENLNDQASTTDEDLDNQVHDDVINGITFNAADYSHKTASSMWNGAVAGNVVVKACLICANVIKAVCKVVFNVVKAVFRGLKRLWNKFVKPVYQSKDFVASESDDTDNYVDIPLFMVQDLEFDRQMMADMVYSGLLNSMEFKYTIPDRDTLDLIVNGGRNDREITAPSVSGFSKAITEDADTEAEELESTQRFKLQTRWEVEGISYKSVKDSFNLPSYDYQSHVRGKMTAHIDLPCGSHMIGDTGYSKVYDSTTVNTSILVYKSQETFKSNDTISMYVNKGSSIMKIEKSTFSGSLLNPTFTTVTIGEIHLQDGWTFEDIGHKSHIFGGLYSVSYDPVSKDRIPSVPGVVYNNTRGTIDWSFIASNADNDVKIRIYMEAPVYWFDPDDGAVVFETPIIASPTITHVDVLPGYVHLNADTKVVINSDVSLYGNTASNITVESVTFAGMVECVPCTHIIFPKKEENFEIVYHDANVVCLEEKSSRQQYCIECIDGIVTLSTNGLNHQCSFDAWADWTNGRYEYFEPHYYNFHDTIDVCYRNERSSNAYFIVTHKLSYFPQKTMTHQVMDVTYSTKSYYNIDGQQHVETEWIDNKTVIWHSRPIETISKSSLYSLLSDCACPIDVGCATVFRFKFGCMEMYSSTDHKLTCVAYLNPIDYTQLLDSNLNWLSSVITDDDTLFNAIQMSFTTKSEWTVDETGDVLAYKDIVASYKLWDLVMWMLCNPHLDTIDYFSMQYPVYLSQKNFKSDASSIDRKDFVDVIYTDSITVDKACNFFYCMLYYIISNKPSYMRIYYILTGSFPTFVPYLVGDRLLAPKWHIQTDDDIQHYVDNFASILVIAAAVIAASVIFGLSKKIIKKKVRLKQLDKSNKVTASKGKAVSQLKDKNAKQSAYDDAKSKLKKLSPSSPEYNAALNDVKSKREALKQAQKSYKSSLVSQAKDERALARFDKLAAFLGVTASTTVCRFDDSSTVDQFTLLSDDSISDNDLELASSSAIESSILEINAKSTSISSCINNIDENVEGIGSDIADVYSEMENMSTKQDVQSMLTAISTITTGLSMLEQLIHKSKAPDLNFGM